MQNLCRMKQKYAPMLCECDSVALSIATANPPRSFLTSSCQSATISFQVQQSWHDAFYMIESGVA